ncbi:tRNA (adenosine(37)-N6)-threonylcarbamoyltransferase complex dimerization subunit type 1 TsaB [Arthrobacter monumenti]
MLILAIDTSAIASAALVSDDAPAGAETPAGSAGSFAVPRIVAAFATEDTRSHAEVLAPGIDAMLAEAHVTSSDLDAIVVGVGPGPFTGLRSGIVTARTLSFVWKLPLHGMMSLDAVAWSVAGSADPYGSEGTVSTNPATGAEFLVATDARRKEVYWAKYRQAEGKPELVEGPHVGPAAGLPPLPVYGAGAGLYADVVNAVPEHTLTQPEAGALGSLALLRLAAGKPLRDTAPLYLRESDAKVPGPRKRALETEKR